MKATADRRASWLKDGTAVLLLLAVCIVLFRHMLFNPDALPQGNDLIRQYYPWRVFAEGTPGDPNPLWIPFSTSGEPLLANLQNARFYPLDQVLEAILPVHRAMVFGLFLHLWMLGAGTYLLARHLVVHRGAALVAACTMMLGHYVLSQLFAGHYTVITAAAWMPLIFLVGKRASETRDYRLAPMMAALVGLQLLAGHPQTTLLTLAMTGAYVVLALIRRGRADRRWGAVVLDGAILAGAVVLGVALTAIQLLPTIEFEELSTRAGGLGFQFAAIYSFPFQALAGLLFPHVLGSVLNDTYLLGGPYWEFAIYVGVLPLVLVFVPLFLRGGNLMIWFLLGVAFAALVMALGFHTPIYWLAWRFIPGMSTFRVPARFVLLITFSLALLAAYGMAALAGPLSDVARGRLRRFARLVLIIAVPSALAAAIAAAASGPLLSKASDLLQSYFATRPDPTRSLEWYSSRLGSVYWSGVKDLVLFAVITAAVGALLTRRAASERPPRWFVSAATAVVIINLLVYDAPMVRTASLAETYRPTPLDQFLKSRAEGYRVYDRDRVHMADLEIMHGIRMLDGYNSMRLKHMHETLRVLRRSPMEDSQGVMNVLGVRYLITRDPLAVPWLTLAYSESGAYVYENASALPRAYLIDSADRDASLVDSGRENAGRGAIAERIRIVTTTSNEFILDVDAASSSTLVLNEVAYPGWRVWVDGEARPIVAPYGLLRGVEITAGRHAVRFAYEVRSLESGKRITLVAGVLLALGFAFTLLRRP